ncbi:MAG: YfiR family protein, partial [Bacteroidales bacterium]|nr:YfiR family protein [Bacteroidales bacterium]
MIKKIKIFLIVLFGFLIIPIMIFSQTEEYTIKAVFMERFTRFTEWPAESAINDTTKPFVISVIGKNPFGNLLEETYSSQKILNKNV